MSRAPEALAMMKEHFPGVLDTKLTPWSELYATGIVQTGGSIYAVEKQREIDRVNRIAKLSEDLMSEWRSIPPVLKLGCIKDVNVSKFVYDLTGTFPAKGKLAQERFPKKVGALGKVMEGIQGSMAIHHKQRNAEFTKKVAVVDFARESWRHLKQKEPPSNANEGNPFFKYVAALIEFARGEDWKVANCLRAWRSWNQAE